jgi:hypothetical protein
MMLRNLWNVVMTAAVAAFFVTGPLEETARADSATTIVNEGSNMCLEVIPNWNDSSNFNVNGLRVVQAPCNGTPEQIWDVRYQWNPYGYGIAHIVNRRSGQCLDVTDGHTTNGNHLQQWTCNGNSNTMLWYLDWGAWGNIHSRLDYNKCIDIRGGSQQSGAVAQIYGCSTSGTNSAQSFSYVHP